MPEQYQDPGLTELQKATSIWEDVGNAPVVPGFQKSDPNMPILKRQINYSGGSMSGYPSPSRSAGSVRATGYGGGGGAIAAGSMQQPYKPVEFKAPGQLSLPEYKPPEYDQGQERQYRREYMAPGEAQARRATQEAIISSKSMDNPNARALFIRNALQGLGGALEKISAGATQQARAEANQRHQNEVAAYVGEWNRKARESQAKYDASWQTAMFNFQEQQTAARSEQQLSGQAGGSPGAMVLHRGARGKGYGTAWWKEGPSSSARPSLARPSLQ